MAFDFNKQFIWWGGHAAEARLRLKTHEPEKLLELILEEIRKRVNNVIVLDEYSR